MIGVNGVGKTTSVGKLAGKLKDQGKKVILAAADTFRAAAGTQLQEWANRAGVEMIGGQEGADQARSYTMQLQRQRQEMQTCYCVIRREDSIIKRT